jgi:hypothetical protein
MTTIPPFGGLFNYRNSLFYSELLYLNDRDETADTFPS